MQNKEQSAVNLGEPTMWFINLTTETEMLVSLE
jgi:hypothetical protein